MRRWLKRLGLALSLGAVSLLAFHSDHAEVRHSAQDHHCCPCHHYSVSPNAAVAAPAPTLLFAERAPAVPAAIRPVDVLGPGAARAPPFS